MNEFEYVGRILDPRLKGKFDKNRRYIVTILNQQTVIRCDICTAPDGLGLHAMNIVPDIDGSHIGEGIVNPALDYQRGVNEWFNLRMRGLNMVVNPAWLVNTKALPNWKQLEDHPPGKMFPMEGDYDARRALQALTPADTSGKSWDQMMGFMQRDHDLTTGTSASRLGSIEDEQRTATEMAQVKEGADRRSNALVYVATRTGHKPLLWSMIKYTLSHWSSPKTLNLINRKTFQRQAVKVGPEHIRNAKILFDVIDNTGGSIDQQMKFYASLYKLSMGDPLINRVATLLKMLKNSRIVNDPYDLLTVDAAGMQRNMMAMDTLNEKAFKGASNMETDLQKSTG
jgi:hypothetical protein